ncbi:MAG: Permease YjgP/YjgQ family protein [Chthoniobacteraceae bacterium]|nr:Permease YjgP/YjgQ family protein [Chthoniobacteraceae bacterium]MDB6171522.1 Permease YjgP/YjgQ family protein [Chthoniobacteraceae bacterium]
MKLLDRYVTRQVLSTSTYAVSILSVVLVLGNVFKKLLDLLINQNIPAEQLLSFVAYILPVSLTFTIPWGFLTAVLLVFGKMSAENELIALRSNGVSIPRICMPVFAIALIFVAICTWINVDVAPRAETKMKDALYNIAMSNPLAMFGGDKVIDEFPDKKIYVEKHNGPELENILVYEVSEDYNPIRVVFAKRGILSIDRANNQLLLQLTQAQFELRDTQEPQNLLKLQRGVAFETTFPISLEELQNRSKKRKGLSSLTVNELEERLSQEKAGKLSKSDAKRAAAERSSARTEVSKRFSFAMASFAFGLIGIPLAMTAHRKETSVGFLLSLIVAFVYFCLIILIDTVRENPALHPELLIWSPNLIFIGLGAWLFYRLSRR